MNGYTSIEIAGNKVGLKFAFPAIKWFGESVADDKDGVYFMEGSLTDYGIAKLMQCAYRNNCLLKEEEPTLKLGAFADWIETALESEEGKALLVGVMTVYSESSVSKKLVESQADEKKSQQLAEPTKESTSTPSNPSLTENSDGSHGIYTEPLSATSY